MYITLSQDDMETAISMAEEAIQQNPGKLESWEGWAQIATFCQQWPEAIKRWNKICELFPDSASGYSGLAQAMYESGNVEKAIILCLQGLALDSSEPTALATYARIGIHRGDYAQALALCERGRSKWLRNPDFYVLASQALYFLDKVERAESACLEGMANAPGSPAPYIEYAEIRMRQKDWLGASSRWLMVRRRFPGHPSGYKHGVETAICIKDLQKAEEICLEAMRYSPAALTKITVPADYAQAFLTWAKEPLRTDWQMEALRRLQVYMALFPAQREGYIESAKILLEQERGQKAEAVARAALKYFPQDAEILTILADSSMLQDKFAQARNYWQLMPIIFPKDINATKLAISRLLQLGGPQAARQLFQSNKDFFKDVCERARIEFSLSQQAEPLRIKEHLLQLCGELQTALKLQVPLDENSRLCLNVMAQLASYDEQSRNLHEAAMASMILSQPPKAKASGRPRKICFYSNPGSLSYFSAVLRYFLGNEVDILVKGNLPVGDLFKERGLEHLQVKEECRINDYEFVISDANAHDGYSQPQSGQTLICFWHASDAIGPVSKPGAGAFLLPFQNSALFGSLHLNHNERGLMRNLDNSQKCEVAYTGPYHMDQPEDLDKMQLRAEIASVYNKNIPTDRPLVYVLESEVCDSAQMVHAINRITSYATVVCKLTYCPQNLRRLINKDVIIIPQRYAANNKIRFAADYILSEFGSGSTVSSLLLGLPVIPFYSRLCKFKYSNYSTYKPVSFTRYIKSEPMFVPDLPIARNPKDFMLRYMKANNLLFDILDTVRIRDAITKGSFKKLYDAHLPFIQKEAFGDYLRVGAAKKTAELILRFANTGTFGDDCAAILLK